MTEKKSRENYTRVTTVLYPFSGLDKLDPEVVAHAGERGSKVHKICEAIIQGLGELGVEEETKGYVESFKKWWGEGKEVVLLEQRFWDDILQITGQIDLIINTPEGLAIVDLKTSYKPSPTWEVQGNAYARLARKSGYDIKRIFFLHLNKHGKEAKIYEYPVTEIFNSVAEVWKHFYAPKEKQCAMS